MEQILPEEPAEVTVTLTTTYALPDRLEISNVLVNLDKIIKNTNNTNSKNPVSSVVNNTQVNITTEQISTADLLNKMRIAKENK